MRCETFFSSLYNDELVSSGAPHAEMVAIAFAATHAFVLFVVDVWTFQKNTQYLHAPPVIYVLGKKGPHTK
jgi:hypothetical protein